MATSPRRDCYSGAGFRLLRVGLRFLYYIDAMGSVLSPKRGGQTWLSMEERLD